MDVLGVNMKKCKKIGKRSKKSIKVVYISSPMKVKTSASEFRALVQELTGKNSDAATRFMDYNDNEVAENYSLEIPDHQRAAYDHHHVSIVPEMNSYHESPSTTSSDSPNFDSFDRGFFPAMEGSFMSMLQLPNNFFHESFQLDVLN